MWAKRGPVYKAVPDVLAFPGAPSVTVAFELPNRPEYHNYASTRIIYNGSNCAARRDIDSTPYLRHFIYISPNLLGAVPCACMPLPYALFLQMMRCNSSAYSTVFSINNTFLEKPKAPKATFPQMRLYQSLAAKGYLPSG